VVKAGRARQWGWGSESRETFVHIAVAERLSKATLFAARRLGITPASAPPRGIVASAFALSTQRRTQRPGRTDEGGCDKAALVADRDGAVDVDDAQAAVARPPPDCTHRRIVRVVCVQGMQYARFEVVPASPQRKSLQLPRVRVARLVFESCLPVLVELHFQARLSIDQQTDADAHEAALAAENVERRAFHVLALRGKRRLARPGCRVRNDDDVCGARKTFGSEMRGQDKDSARA